MALVHWEVQRAGFSCGAACLRNALQVLGKSVDEQEVRRRARTTPQDGTSETDLCRAIRSYGYRPRVGRWSRRREDAQAAWTWLCKELDAGHPVILNVDDLSHWVLAVGRIGDRIAISDPQRVGRIVPGRVVKLYSRRKLLGRWWCNAGRLEGKGLVSEFYGVALSPRTRAAKLRAATAPRVTEEVLRRILCSDSVYIADVANDLRAIFPSRPGRRSYEPAGMFLERHREVLLGVISYWSKAVDGRRLRAQLATYVAVARAMPNLAINPRGARTAIANLTAMLTMNTGWAPIQQR